MTHQSIIRSVLFAGALAGSGLGLAQQGLPLEPHRDAGQSIIGVFEGWYHNPDGTKSMMMGYYNRNLKEDVDVPVGAANRIEPGGPDRGQPTHFKAGRNYGSFVVKVPKDFGDKKMNWVITANGKTTTIPMNLKTDWELQPFKDSTFNTPPVLSFQSFDTKGATVQGPDPINNTMRAQVGEPLALTIYAADDDVVPPGVPTPKTPVYVTWIQMRGPAPVAFSNSRPAMEKTTGAMPAGTKYAGKATTTATFTEPGDYVLEVVGNDSSGEGGGGFQCCWTNATVKVSVSPRAMPVSGGF